MGLGDERRDGGVRPVHPYGYADPVAQRRIEQLEASVQQYERRLLRMKLCYLDANDKAEQLDAERDELRAKVARLEHPQP